MTLHPATQLAVWAALALAMQFLSLAGLGALALPAMLLALAACRRRSGLLLYRSRWLLLSIVLLFAFATPGRPLVAGVTLEGLLLAGEHGLRLILMLVTLAILHERLGNRGLLAGLYAALSPLRHWRQLRERIVARLLLVLDYVEEGAGPGGWRAWLAPDAGGGDRIELSVAPLRASDWIVLAVLAVVPVAWGRLA